MFNRLYVELDTDFIKYIYAKAGSKKARVSKFGSMTMPPDTFVNGKVENKEAFVLALKEIKKELGIRRCSVNVSVRDGSTITRPVELPILNEKDVEKHLSLEAEQYLPINMRNYQVSFRIEGKRTGSDGSVSSVMVAAMPTESINSILECFDSCKLDARILDVYPNGICRILNGLEEDNIAVIDIGRRGINITITENRSFYMHSYLQFNLEAVLEGFRNDSHMEAAAFLGKYFYKEYDSMKSTAEEAGEGLEALLSGMLGQVSRYLDYFSSRHFGKTVDRVYVIGDYALLKGLRSMMAYSLRTEVVIGLDTFGYISRKSSSAFEKVMVYYCSLIGMIMRGNKL